MMNEASDLVADLMEANDLLLTDPEERELRYRAQRSALRNCRKLIHHIELAHEILSGFSDDAFAYWAKMAAGVKNQTAKWYKTDKERAAKLGAHVATIPPKVIRQLYTHPLTHKGLDAFVKDWAKTGQSIL